MVDRYTFYSRTFFVTLWITLCWGFIATDVIPSLTKLTTVVHLISDIVFTLLSLAVLRDNKDKIIIISFLVISILSEYLNHSGMVTYFNGLRDFAGLLFATPLIRYFVTCDNSKKFTESFDIQLYIFLWIQVLCIVSQFLRFGAGDRGGGSLGDSSSGTISTLIYCISFYLMNKRWNNEISYFQNIAKNWILIFLLFPTFLNETKISLIYFVAYFILLMKIDRQFILRLVIAIPFMALLALGASYVYLSAQNTTHEYDLTFFNDYLLGDDIEQLIDLSQAVQDEVVETDNLWVVDLPRFGRWLAVPEAISHTGGGFLLGGGIGMFKGGTTLATTRFATEYGWLLGGSVTMLFFIFMQLGLIGLIWILYAYKIDLIHPSGSERSINIKTYLCMMTFMMLLYLGCFRNFYFCIIIYYLAFLGYNYTSRLNPKIQS